MPDVDVTRETMEAHWEAGKIRELSPRPLGEEWNVPIAKAILLARAEEAELSLSMALTPPQRQFQEQRAAALRQAAEDLG